MDGLRQPNPDYCRFATLSRAASTGTGAKSIAALPFGVDAIDRHLPQGGLARGHLHEALEAGAASQYVPPALEGCANSVPEMAEREHGGDEQIKGRLLGTTRRRQRWLVDPT